MFRVMAVDDEPSALDFLCAMVEKRCDGYRMTVTAEDGEQALQRMAAEPPDVLITDIKMPVMDGVTLARRVREKYPWVRTLVVSGYQEYEYVRGALREGVYDYLLKPLSPASFAEALGKLRPELEEMLMDRRSRMLSALSRGERPDAGEMARCFPNPAYEAVLARRNGLPKRFQRAVPPEIFFCEGDELSIFGRDDMERVCLRPAAGQPEAFMEKVMNREGAQGAYVTAVSSRAPFPIAQFPDVFRRLQRMLDGRAVLGETQAIFLDEPYARVKLPDAGDAEPMRELEQALQAGSAEQAREKLGAMMRDWARRKMPQLWLERQLRYVLFLANRADPTGRLSGVDEHLLDDAFFSITDMEEMIRYMDELIFPYGAEDEDAQRMDSRERFEQVCAYVRANLALPLSAQSVCRQFGFSQSTLGKMFRKYADKSFGTFLTETRMERACAMLRADQDMLVREVAEMVGYTDPLYFSKSFRACTGMSPRSYAASEK